LEAGGNRDLLVQPLSTLGSGDPHDRGTQRRTAVVIASRRHRGVPAGVSSWAIVDSKGVPGRGTRYGAIRTIAPVQGPYPRSYRRSPQAAGNPLIHHGLYGIAHAHPGLEKIGLRIFQIFFLFFFLVHLDAFGSWYLIRGVTGTLSRRSGRPYAPTPRRIGDHILLITNKIGTRASLRHISILTDVTLRDSSILNHTRKFGKLAFYAQVVCLQSLAATSAHHIRQKI